MQYEYYYMRLSKSEKDIYKELHEGVKEFKPLVSFKKHDGVNYDRVVRALEFDHPELYYWDSRVVKSKTRGNDAALKIDYFIEQNEVNRNAPKVEKGITSILGKCNSQFGSEYDRFKSIYDCMVRNINYVNAIGNSDRDSAYAHTILGVFEKHSAVCDGISKAFKLVLERAGIDCIVVLGAKRTEGTISDGHAWNIIWIDDKPCHVDLTWAIEQSKNGTVNHDYVGLTDKQITKDHSIDSLLTVPKCKTDEFDYYVRNNAVIKSEDALRKYLKANASKKPFEINVRLVFECNLQEIEKKATDYIVAHYVIKSQHIKLTTKRRDEQGILVIAGE